MGGYLKPRLRDFANYPEYAEAFSDWQRATSKWDAQMEQPRQSGGQRRRSGSWQSGGSVDGQPARTKQEGTRTRAIHGTPELKKGDGHGEIITNDGINAAYVRDPGMDHSDYVVDDTKDEPYGPRDS